MHGARTQTSTSRRCTNASSTPCEKHSAHSTPLYRQNKVTPHVSLTLPLERVAEAVVAIASRKTVGKVVLTM
jgi:NADPH:quinone reductase-like Zn-dependent oxidoreductase